MVPANGDGDRFVLAIPGELGLLAGFPKANPKGEGLVDFGTSMVPLSVLLNVRPLYVGIDEPLGFLDSDG